MSIHDQTEQPELLSKPYLLAFVAKKASLPLMSAFHIVARNLNLASLTDVWFCVGRVGRGSRSSMAGDNSSLAPKLFTLGRKKLERGFGS